MRESNPIDSYQVETISSSLIVIIKINWTKINVKKQNFIQKLKLKNETTINEIFQVMDSVYRCKRTTLDGSN